MRGLAPALPGPPAPARPRETGEAYGEPRFASRFEGDGEANGEESGCAPERCPSSDSALGFCVIVRLRVGRSVSSLSSSSDSDSSEDEDSVDEPEKRFAFDVRFWKGVAGCGSCGSGVRVMGGPTSTCEEGEPTVEERCRPRCCCCCCDILGDRRGLGPALGDSGLRPSPKVCTGDPAALRRACASRNAATEMRCDESLAKLFPRGRAGGAYTEADDGGRSGS